MIIKMIVTENTISTRKAVKKWSEIPVNNEYLRGTVKITNYRKYSLHSEVDVTYEGEIFVSIVSGYSSWFDKSILTKYLISKIKLNRFLRKKLLNDVKNRLNYFDVDLRTYHDIRKIKWI